MRHDASIQRATLCIQISHIILSLQVPVQPIKSAIHRPHSGGPAARATQSHRSFHGVGVCDSGTKRFQAASRGPSVHSKPKKRFCHLLPKTGWMSTLKMKRSTALALPQLLDPSITITPSQPPLLATPTNMICWASGFLGTYFSRVPRMPLVRRSEPNDRFR